MAKTIIQTPAKAVVMQPRFRPKREPNRKKYRRRTKHPNRVLFSFIAYRKSFVALLFAGIVSGCTHRGDPVFIGSNGSQSFSEKELVDLDSMSPHKVFATTYGPIHSSVKHVTTMTWCDDPNCRLGDRGVNKVSKFDTDRRLVQVQVQVHGADSRDTMRFFYHLDAVMPFRVLYGDDKGNMIKEEYASARDQYVFGQSETIRAQSVRTYGHPLYQLSGVTSSPFRYVNSPRADAHERRYRIDQTGSILMVADYSQLPDGSVLRVEITYDPSGVPGVYWTETISGALRVETRTVFSEYRNDSEGNWISRKVCQHVKYNQKGNRILALPSSRCEYDRRSIQYY